MSARPVDLTTTMRAVPLPSKVTLRDGFTFDPRPDRWIISSLQHRARTYDFTEVPMLGRPLVHFLKLTILDVFEKQSVSHADNLWGRFCEFYRAVLFAEGPVQIIGIVNLLNFRAVLTIETVWKLGLVRVLLERATRLGYPVATSEASAY